MNLQFYKLSYILNFGIIKTNIKIKNKSENRKIPKISVVLRSAVPNFDPRPVIRLFYLRIYFYRFFLTTGTLTIYDNFSKFKKLYKFSKLLNFGNLIIFQKKITNFLNFTILF